jgi:hypothetical protein
MKKILIITSVLLLIASAGFADQVTSTGGSLAIGGGDSTDTLSMGLSSNVSAVYEDGDVTKTQWYAIATSHLGGKQVYGTAQDVTNLYKLATEKTPGDAADWTGMPTNNTSSNEWSSGVWVKL